MNLRTRLGLQLIAGTAVLIATTCVVRSAIARSEQVAAATIAAQTVAEDVLWQFERRQEQLGARITAVNVVLAGQAFDADPSPRAWSDLVREVIQSPDETLALIAPTGEILEADGALAGDRSFLAAALQQRAFAGAAGISGLRTGLLAAQPEPLVVATAGLLQERTTGGVDRSATRAQRRLALVGPLSRRPLMALRRDLSVEIHAISGTDLPLDLEEIVVGLWRTEGRHAELMENGAREVRTITDGAGRPAFVLNARAFADIGTLVPKSVRENLVWELLVAAIAIAIALRFVAKAVIEPIEQLHGQASRLARTEHGQLAFHVVERGEIGAFAQSLDAMLRKIELDRSRFVRNARIAGMSDVSMGVVHSAGNILNSVNVSTKLLVRELRSIGIDDMKAMVSELEEHADDLTGYIESDENGRFLIPFMTAMTNAVADIRTRCMLELDSVDRGVTHVVDLIRSQEKYAIGASVVETTDVSEVVEMSLQIASMTIEGADKIIVERSYCDLTPARIDRHRLTSVLINIISNAIEALLSEGAPEQRLEVSTYPMDGERFVIEITDTGIGIAPENLDLIFTSAFTTKAGSSGEGLHTTANACKELGIAIGVVSQGLNSGCTFKLRAPYEPPGDVDDSRATRSRASAAAEAAPAAGGVAAGGGQARSGAAAEAASVAEAGSTLRIQMPAAPARLSRGDGSDDGRGSSRARG